MAGNWKMNLNHLEAIALVQKLAFTLPDKDYDAGRGRGAAAVHRPAQRADAGRRRQAARSRYGAQDLSPHDSGAYTGEISGAMLAKLGCTYVVVGHSERRAVPRRDDALVNAKVEAALPARADADRVRRRGARGPRGGRARRAHARAARRLAGRAVTPSRSARSWSPTSRSGRSAPARWPPRTTRRRSARRSATRLAELATAGDAADGVRILYGGSVKANNVAGIMAQAGRRRRAGRRRVARRRGVRHPVGHRRWRTPALDVPSAIRA